MTAVKKKDPAKCYCQKKHSTVWTPGAAGFDPGLVQAVYDCRKCGSRSIRLRYDH